MILKIYKLLKGIDKSITLKQVCNIIIWFQESDPIFNDTVEIYNRIHDAKPSKRIVENLKEFSKNYFD